MVSRSAVNLDTKTTADMERPVLGVLSEVKTRLMHTARPLIQYIRVSFATVCFTTLVQSDRALPTCGASLSQLKRPSCT